MQTSSIEAHDWSHLYQNRKVRISGTPNRTISVTYKGETHVLKSGEVRIGFFSGATNTPPYYILRLGDAGYLRFNFANPRPLFIGWVLYILASILYIITIAPFVAGASMTAFIVFIAYAQKIPINYYLQHSRRQLKQKKAFLKLLQEQDITPEVVTDIAHINTLRRNKALSQAILPFFYVFVFDVLVAMLLRLFVFDAPDRLQGAEAVALVAWSLVGGTLISVLIGYGTDRIFVKESVYMYQTGQESDFVKFYKDTMDFFRIPEERMLRLVQPVFSQILFGVIINQVIWVIFYLWGSRLVR